MSKNQFFLGAAITGVLVAGYVGYQYLVSRAEKWRLQNMSMEERVLYQQLSHVSSFCRQDSISGQPGCDSVIDARFKEIDKDGNGYITRDELDQHLREFAQIFLRANPTLQVKLVDENGEPAYDRAVDEVFRQVDANQDGVIDKTEFGPITEQFLATLLFGDMAIPL